MSESSYKTIRNSAIASVIAGIFLLIVPIMRQYFFSFLSWLWSGVIWFWEASIASYSLPGWAWFIVFIFAAKGFANLYLAMKGESEKPEYNSYIEDSIHGAKWRWSWIGNQLTNIWCYCPRCDATLVYDDSSSRDIFADIRKTDFRCENCRNKVIASITGGNKDYAIGAITREIERRIRTSEYKKH